MDMHSMFKRTVLSTTLGLSLVSTALLLPSEAVFAFPLGMQDSSKTAGEVIDDATITGEIKTKLMADSITHALNINVDTDKGVVVLAGTAHSTEERAKAVQLAHETKGVKRVEDQLVIASSSTQNPQTLSAKTKVAAEKVGDSTHDGWITTKVKSKFATTEGIKSGEIHVSTQNGVVRLEGQVNSEQARQEAIKQATNTEGVNRVDASGLTVVKVDAQ